MAIADGTAGAWVATTTRNPTVTLPSHSAGDMLLVRVGWKSATPTTDVAVCNTSGWAKLGQYYDGGGVSANGGGGVLVALFWKVATSSSETNPVIEFDDATSPTPGAYCAVTYTKGATEDWLDPVGDGGSIAAATTYSTVVGSNFGVTAGDMVDAFAVTNDNTTLTSPSISQAGVTFDTVTEYPATALSSATSNDISADGCNKLATAGTSTGATNITGTNSVADPGAGWATRLRVQTIVIEALAGTSDAAATAEAAVTRTRGLAGTAAETSDASLASPQRALKLAGTSDAAATASAAASVAKPLAGASAASSTASGLVGRAIGLAGTSAATSTGVAEVRKYRSLAATSDASSTGVVAAIQRTRPLAATAAAASDSAAELTREAGGLKPLAGTADASSTAEAALFRARTILLAGTAAGTATAAAIATKYRGLQASATAQGAATGAFWRERALPGSSAAQSDATAVISSERLRALAGLADAISSAGSVVTVELGLQGISAGVSGTWDGAILTVVPLERRRWDGTQWNPGELYRRRWSVPT